MNYHNNIVENIRLFCTNVSLILCIILFFTLSHTTFADVILDGKVNPIEWQDAKVFSSFIQSFPNTGDTPRYPTKTYLLTDEKGIYVAFENQQPLRSRTYSGHDQFTSADFNMVLIDFNNDGDTAYEFVATLGGGTMDGTYSRGNQSNRDWDGVWQVKVSEQGDYWYSEFFIPWTTATYQQHLSEQREISIYFQRQNVVDSQAYSFPDTNRGRKNFTYEFEPVMVDNVQGQSLRTSIYVSDNYNFLLSDNDINTGIDFTWKPKVNQQVIATINPDFGQVESDELIVNYSAVETLRTDKRPFFTENQSLFDVQGPSHLKLMNTRRIGGNAERETNQIHNVIAAGKYIYNNSNLNIGALFAQEDDVVGNDGKTFASVRWYNALNKLSTGQLVNYVVNPINDRKSLVFNQDIRYQLSDSINIFSNLLYSHNEDKLGKSIGKGATFKASYVPVRHWQNNLEWTYLDDQLDVNDFGYQQRNNISNMSVSSRYDNYQYDATSSILRTRMYGEYNFQRNTQGLNLRDDWYMSYVLRLKNKQTFRVGGKQVNKGYDDLITRQLGFVEMPKQRDLHFYYGTPTPATFSFNTVYNYFQEGESDWASKVSLNTTTYFTDTIRLNANYVYIDSSDWLVGNTLGDVSRYSRTLNKVYAKLITKLDDNSDLTVTSQWYAMKARGIETTNSQFMKGDDFNASRFSFQARYRYLFSGGSRFYLVYAHNGYDDSDEKGIGYNSLLLNAVTDPEEKSLTAKFNWFF
jgi:hypothetical protein